MAKIIFCEGAKKVEKIDPNHPHFQKVSSYKTMESYRSIWNNFFNYLKEHWLLKDCEKISAEHVAAYMDYKIEYYPSKQYLEKISSALGKLEIALKHFAKNIYGVDRDYDFSIRQVILDEARDMRYVVSNYHNRTYINPELLINNLIDPLHKTAAKIQYEGGARIEAVSLIKNEQLRGEYFDEITQSMKYSILTKEKGGKEGNINITVETYSELLQYFNQHKIFKIKQQNYYNDIKQSVIKSKEVPEASHGLRWNFAKRRMFEYAQAGFTYQESLQQVSFEMKHNRSSITEHYLI